MSIKWPPEILIRNTDGQKMACMTYVFTKRAFNQSHVHGNKNTPFKIIYISFQISSLVLNLVVSSSQCCLVCGTFRLMPAGFWRIGYGWNVSALATFEWQRYPWVKDLKPRSNTYSYSLIIAICHFAIKQRDTSSERRYHIAWIFSKIQWLAANFVHIWSCRKLNYLLHMELFFADY